MQLELKGDQPQALDAVAKWYHTPRNQRKPTFRLFGGAGVGKTTVAQKFQDFANVAYMTLSGKAALVMRKKGCENASTIHSSIYRLLDEGGGSGSMVWELNPGALVGVDLIILDEAAMAPVSIGMDLESFGIPILGLGDQNQLPPPSNEQGYLELEKPDFIMRKILRQAEESPIIGLAYQALENGKVKPGKYGTSEVFSDSVRDSKVRELMLAADQVICGKNATRHYNNSLMRKWRGHEGTPLVHCPIVGDRLICLRNNHRKGTLNGEQFIVKELLDRDLGAVSVMTVESLDSDSKRPIELEVPFNYFNGTEGQMPKYERESYDQATYADVITCHKAQGSTFRNPLIINEAGAFREHKNRWLYTAITRASEEVKII